MKKVILIATMVASLAGLNAFGQGNFVFNSGGRFVWNNTGGAPVPGGAFNVAFLYGNNLTISNSGPGTLTGHALIPTNNISGGGAQGSAYTPSGAAEWNSIMSDPNFQFGRDNGTGLIAVGTLTAVGGINYNGGSPFAVTGTSTAGGNVMVYWVAFPNTFATPAAAAAADANLGWSAVFNYAYSSSASSPTGMGTQAAAQGVDGHFGVALVPEPTTFALAGLGAAALLIFRRRK